MTSIFTASALVRSPAHCLSPIVKFGKSSTHTQPYNAHCMVHCTVYIHVVHQILLGLADKIYYGNTIHNTTTNLALSHVTFLLLHICLLLLSSTPCTTAMSSRASKPVWAGWPTPLSILQPLSRMNHNCKSDAYVYVSRVCWGSWLRDQGGGSIMVINVCSWMLHSSSWQTLLSVDHELV